ncbi:plasma-membrane proton-efflux P-type ATPase [Pseudorhodoplanes sinuspersici]|uniref:Plasma-membrane proton-efflux P-type ATPase n=1 Tax=Pseudorhodoplanes sinuspersici TaxID=1235591 RepID=A0A1W6ZYR6_9HYPH|nr:plasma-membrane proton-efflux P-type ATPase [Pseudorhodoplanes sinuspersici]ARQ02291.1 plasma-membrane proton-efflux P-type ATPase [Pseudorhodoplanes sinuspersici]RKE74118.1 H+-transporting ATPase [Pseudorhodoplanes sinuspersici]
MTVLDRSATSSAQISSAQTTLNAEQIDAALAALQTTPKGLTGTEATARLAKYGRNAIEAKTESRWRKLAAYFWGPLPWMIEAAALISLVRRDWPDFFVVGGLLLYNAAVGFWQDYKASNALDALKKGLAPKARVLRDGTWTSIDAATLVPGDVVNVSAGQIVPADLLLIDGEYLTVDQSALTGESLPVSKKIGDAAYSGGIAKQGDMTGVVTKTGNATFFGRTAKLVASAGSVSHSQKAVLQIGDFLILVAFALAIILVGIEVYRYIVVADEWNWSTVGSIAQFVLILLVASIPVALPAVMSVTMAIGAYALSKQKAILSRLSAIEELAGVDILCSDKTGTLTMNQLSLDATLPFGSFKQDDVLTAAALATQTSSQDPIDLAVLRALKDRSAIEGAKQTKFVPFDPVNKRTMATVIDAQGKTHEYAKGAPQVIAALANADVATLTRYNGTVSELASKGYRALGVARSDDGKTWQLVGLISLQDPPRADAKATIAETEKLGLNVKMVTGDDVAIGDQIAKQLGMGDHLVVASDVFKDGVTSISPDVAAAVERADGFGRVFPQHKYEIVKSLQQRGHIVAMTGDGVNDAPALRQADCGIAVSGATDAARSAAALILTAPGLSTIVNAIVGARQIFQRIQSYVHYRIAMTLDIMLLVVASIVFFEFQPLTAVMIVVLALLDDIPIMTIAYDNVAPAPRPQRWNMHSVLVFSCLMGLLSFAESLGLLLIGLEWLSNQSLMSVIPLDHNSLKTMMFLQLAVGGHLLLFVVRSRHSVFFPPYPSSSLLLAIVATQVVAILICGFGILMPKLPWAAVLGVWIYCLVWMVVIDLVKLLYVRREAEQGGHLQGLAKPIAN